MFIVLIRIVGGLAFIALGVVAVVEVIKRKKKMNMATASARSETGFVPSRTVAGILAFDDTQGLWQIIKTESTVHENYMVYRNENIAEIELTENDVSVSLGDVRLGRASDSGRIIESLCIKITLTDGSFARIDFISMRLDVTASAYVNAFKKAQAVLGALTDVVRERAV